ncbi:CaiB/BaiF CoA transferase family protein [Sphingobium yanoikuyae]|jgi:CoA:oxalate CoA-transferase|uniref:CaiB/BaiF CoA transferase family protein n=1 Tax=Sphingobium yanoikuyae TaxID=13690 RepID=UPI000C110E19|nr:MAG: carnitine dehydratase [Leeuwenhoekiella sp.]
MAENSTAAMAGALDGVRVLDFTSVMAGPFATRMLADLGAQVIKVESLEGDQVRARPPKRDGFSAYFGNLNAGKQSIACNLKSPEIVAIIKQLVATCDVLVENFRPGVMQRFGLDFAALAAINPRLIYCSISGYGQTGPKALHPAYAPVIHAASGFDMVNLRYQDGADRPATSGIFIADVLGGTHAFGAIQAALYQRERTGQGQHIDLSMLEAMVGMLVFETQEAQFPGDARRPLYTPLKTSDGFIMVAPTSPRNFEQLAEAVGHPEWRDDPRFRTNADRNANWATLLALTEEWTMERDAEEAEAILSRHGVPCARYRDIDEVLDDPQLAARGAFAQVSDGAGTFKVPNPPFHMSGSRVEARDYVARLGQDAGDVLAGIGVNADAVAALRASGDLG